MKKIICLFIPLLLIACSLDDDLPRVDTTKHGKKWTLAIGSSPKEVYTQLQKLSETKNFNQVAIAYRKPYTTPSEIKSNLNLYRAITLETTSGSTERILFQFKNNTISAIEIGGGLLDSISKWPQGIPDNTAIQLNDPVSELKDKLIAIYQMPQYQNYQLLLPDKWLEKPFDPTMKNYEQWGFSFSEHVMDLKVGRHAVNLYFKHQKLMKIKDSYDENEVVY